jgi:membrane protein required for beta-lactamase induction
VIIVFDLPWYAVVFWMVVAGVIFATVWTLMEWAWDRLLERSERRHLDQLNAEDAPVDIVDREQDDRGA